MASMEDFAGRQASRRHDFFTPESPSGSSSTPTTLRRNLPSVPAGLQSTSLQLEVRNSISEGGAPPPALAFPFPALLPPVESSHSLETGQDGPAETDGDSLMILRGAVLAGCTEGTQLAVHSPPPSDVHSSPGSSVDETDLDTEPEGTDSPRFGRMPESSLEHDVAMFDVSMRSGVLALGLQGNRPIVSHPHRGHWRGTGSDLQSIVGSDDTGAVRAMAKLRRSTFSLRGELMHVFLSYRVTSEGEAGNGLSGLLAEKVKWLSMDTSQKMQIPRHGAPQTLNPQLQTLNPKLQTLNPEPQTSNPQP